MFIMLFDKFWFVFFDKFLLDFKYLYSNSRIIILFSNFLYEFNNYVYVLCSIIFIPITVTPTLIEY